MSGRHHHKSRGFRHLREHEKFKIVHKNFAKGARGKISVVKRRKDGRLLIWKRPKSGNSMYRKSYNKEIKKIAQWRKFGLTNIEVCWCNDKDDGILKTYVDGPNLKQILKKHPDFFSHSERDEKYVKALSKFLNNLEDCGHYIHDLKMANIIYDKKRKIYQLIDSGPIHKKSKESAVKQHRKMLYKKWSGNVPHNERKNLEHFINKYHN